MKKQEAHNTDILILAGGLGTRLRPLINAVPKVLAPINNEPFLDILIRMLKQNGFRRIILCAGYMSDKVIEHSKLYENCDIVISTEEKPLGTAGAIKNAEEYINSNLFIVINGDSYCKVNFGELIAFHCMKNAVVSVSMVKVENNKDYGSVQMNQDNRIISFQEKIKGADAFVNAGIYCMNKELLQRIPKEENVSLEIDIFPNMIDDRFYGLVTEGPLIDIGTPERLTYADSNPGLFR